MNNGLYYSSDYGQTWTKCSASDSSDTDFATGCFIGGAAYSGRYVAANYNRKDGLYYSTDGITWTKLSVSSDEIFSRIEYANGCFIAEGDSGIWRSKDGRNWTKVSNYKSGAAAYGGGLWVCGSEALSNGLYYSEDNGVTWQASNKTSGYFAKPAYDLASGMWVAVGEASSSGRNYGIYWSTDGKVWNATNITQQRFAYVCGFDGKWVAVRGYDSDGVYVSYDGKTWAQSNVRSGSFQHGSIICDEGRWIVGGNGILVAEQPGMLMTCRSAISSAAAIVDRTKWDIEYTDYFTGALAKYTTSKARFHGRNDLMIPDITLVG